MSSRIVLLAFFFGSILQYSEVLNLFTAQMKSLC